MQVRDVMTQNVECISPKATLRDAAQRMESLNVGALPVCNNDRLVGVLTDRDIVVRSIAAGRDSRTDMVGDIMTPGICYCFEDEDIAEAVRIMRAKQVRRLPVLNQDRRLVGIVALGDLAVETGDEQLVGHALAGISEEFVPGR